jgi:hypothetical protein
MSARAEVPMVVAGELRGKYGRPIFLGPVDQFDGLRAIADDALLAFCLMSTHLHLVAEVDDEPAARRWFRRVARRLDKTAEARGVARLDEPHLQVLPDDHAVLRYVAYAHANPVKAQMVVDPLAWPFSSHRDVQGLRFARWFSPARLVAHMSDGMHRAWLHGEAKGAHPLPSGPSIAPLDWPVEPFDLIRRATASVFGLTEEELAAPKRGADARHCLAVVAELEGWKAAEIADALGWTDRNMRRVSRDVTLPVIAVLTMLRDRRLRPTGNAWWEVPAEARGPRLWEMWWDSRGGVPPVRT